MYVLINVYAELSEKEKCSLFFIMRIFYYLFVTEVHYLLIYYT